MRILGFIVAALTLAASTDVAHAQYYPRERYSAERPPPPPPPPRPPRPHLQPCWNCGHIYPSDVPKCSHCGSPRQPPR